MWGFLRLLHGFLTSCVKAATSLHLVGAHAVQQANDFGSSAPVPAASDSPKHCETHSHHVLERPGTEDTLLSKTECSPRARQTSPMATTTCYAVIFSHSPREHMQAFSLSHQMAGGQINQKEPSFLPSTPVTPTLTDRDRSWSSAASQRASEVTLPAPYRRKE